MLDWNFPVLYLTLLLLAASMVRRRVNHPKVEWIMAASVVLVAGLVQIKTITYLPLKDYRPYAVGESIIQNRLSAEEIGLDAPVYATEYTFKNITTGLDTVILSSDWLVMQKAPSFKRTYEIISYEGAEVKIYDGYEPRIMDLIMENAEGDDLTDEVLSNKGYTFFIFLKISRRLLKPVHQVRRNLTPLLTQLKKKASRFTGSQIQEQISTTHLRQKTLFHMSSLRAIKSS